MYVKAPVFREVVDSVFPLQDDPASDTHDFLVNGSQIFVISETAVGSSVELDMNSNKIIELADGTASTDAVNKSQLDGAITGLDVKDSVRLGRDSDLGASYSSSGGAGGTGQFTSAPTTIDGVAVAQGDRILVFGQTDAQQNGIYEVTATTSTWDRASDFDADAEVTANAFTFISEGNTYADTGWTVTSDNPITLNSSDVDWAQFSAAGVITAGSGLQKTGTILDVLPGDGIEIAADFVAVDLAATPGLEFSGSTPNGELTAKVGDGLVLSASGIEVDLEASTPGLEFSAGDLKAQVQASGALQIFSDGLAIKIDDTPDTLDADSDGLKVVGLPSLFKVNDTAVGASVSAANLDTLTDGSNADALHVHASAAATEAPKVENTLTVDTGETVAVGDPVFVSSNDKVGPCDNANDSESIQMVGVSRTAGAAAASVEIITAGLAEGVLSGATAGEVIYLDTPNGLTSTRPTAGGANVVCVGKAVNATDLMVNGQFLGRNAA